MKALLGGVFATIALLFILVGNQADGQEPKYKIKEVMGKIMKNGVAKKVAAGKGTPEEKELVVELLTALHANTPKKGDPDSFKQRAKALLDAAKAGDNAALTKALDCAGCHKEHK